MKTIKSLLLFIVFAVLAAGASAQSYAKGQKDLHLGIGLVNWYYGSGYSGLVPPVNASFEIGVTENIGVGALVSFSTAKYNVDWIFGDYGWRYTWLTVGGRVAYHLDILEEPKLDTYGGLMLGLYIVNATFYSDDPTINESLYNDPASGGIAYSLFAGARYKFSEKFGVYGELGYGWTLLNVGVDLKF